MKKIVIQVHMKSDKCRSKAMKIAAVSQGVHSVSLEGESRDQVVVTGDGIDCVCLTNQLRKKFRFATLVSVVDANASNGGGDAVGEQQNETTSMSLAYCYGNYPPSCPSYHMVYDPYPNSCSSLAYYNISIFSLSPIRTRNSVLMYHS